MDIDSESVYRGLIQLSKVTSNIQEARKQIALASTNLDQRISNPYYNVKELLRKIELRENDIVSLCNDFIEDAIASNEKIKSISASHEDITGSSDLNTNKKTIDENNESFDVFENPIEPLSREKSIDLAKEGNDNSNINSQDSSSASESENNILPVTINNNYSENFNNSDTSFDGQLLTEEDYQALASIVENGDEAFVDSDSNPEDYLLDLIEKTDYVGDVDKEYIIDQLKKGNIRSAIGRILIGQKRQRIAALAPDLIVFDDSVGKAAYNSQYGDIIENDFPQVTPTPIPQPGPAPSMPTPTPTPAPTITPTYVCGRLPKLNYNLMDISLGKVVVNIDKLPDDELLSLIVNSPDFRFTFSTVNSMPKDSFLRFKELLETSPKIDRSSLGYQWVKDSLSIRIGNENSAIESRIKDQKEAIQKEIDELERECKLWEYDYLLPLIEGGDAEAIRNKLREYIEDQDSKAFEATKMSLMMNPSPYMSFSSTVAAKPYLDEAQKYREMVTVLSDNEILTYWYLKENESYKAAEEYLSSLESKINSYYGLKQAEEDFYSILAADNKGAFWGDVVSSLEGIIIGTVQWYEVVENLFSKTGTMTKSEYEILYVNSMLGSMSFFIPLTKEDITFLNQEKQINSDTYNDLLSRLENREKITYLDIAYQTGNINSNEYETFKTIGEDPAVKGFIERNNTDGGFLGKNHIEWLKNMFNVGTTVGNMIPSIIASYGTAGVLGAGGAALSTINVASKAAGLATMYVYCLSSDKNEALREGRGSFEAWLHGILVASSEVGTELIFDKVFGFIPGLPDFAMAPSSTKWKAIGKIALRLFALAPLGEITEEMVQYALLDPLSDIIAYGDTDFKYKLEDALTIALTTYMSTFLLQLGTTVISSPSTIKKSGTMFEITIGDGSKIKVTYNDLVKCYDQTTGTFNERALTDIIMKKTGIVVNVNGIDVGLTFDEINSCKNEETGVIDRAKIDQLVKSKLSLVEETSHQEQEIDIQFEEDLSIEENPSDDIEPLSNETIESQEDASLANEIIEKLQLEFAGKNLNFDVIDDKCTITLDNASIEVAIEDLDSQSTRDKIEMLTGDGFRRLKMVCNNEIVKVIITDYEYHITLNNEETVTVNNEQVINGDAIKIVTKMADFDLHMLRESYESSVDKITYDAVFDNYVLVTTNGDIIVFDSNQLFMGEADNMVFAATDPRILEFKKKNEGKYKSFSYDGKEYTIVANEYGDLITVDDLFTRDAQTKLDMLTNPDYLEIKKAYGNRFKSMEVNDNNEYEFILVGSLSRTWHKYTFAASDINSPTINESLELVLSDEFDDFHNRVIFAFNYASSITVKDGKYVITRLNGDQIIAEKGSLFEKDLLRKLYVDHVFNKYQSGILAFNQDGNNFTIETVNGDNLVLTIEQLIKPEIYKTLEILTLDSRYSDFRKQFADIIKEIKINDDGNLVITTTFGDEFNVSNQIVFSNNFDIDMTNYRYRHKAILMEDGRYKVIDKFGHEYILSESEFADDNVLLKIYEQEIVYGNDLINDWILNNINNLPNNITPDQQAAMDAEVDKIANRLGASREEVYLAINLGLINVIEQSSFGNRVSQKSLELILKSWIKNQHETNTSAGLLDPKERRNVEFNVFNIPTMLDARDAAVYGMLFPNLDTSSNFARDVSYYRNGPGSTYGGATQFSKTEVVIIYDKSKIMDNTTFTIGDSLDYAKYRSKVGYVISGSPASNPQFTGAYNEFLDNVSSLDEIMNATLETFAPRFGHSSDQYIEIQVHGRYGHEIDVIQEVIFLTSPDLSLTKMLDDMGIKWREVQ